MAGEKIVGVAVDFSSCSRKALKWATDNIIRDGDHLVLITVQPEGYYEDGEMQLWEVTGSPMIPLAEFSDPVIMKKYKMKPDPETLDLLNTVARQKEIVVVLKIYWGDAREKICEAIDKIPLSCLVIGNRGLGKIKRAIMGSVSNFVVNNGSCPITVVKQSDHEPFKCTNAYKYRDLTSKLPLCSLRCYNAIHEKMQPSIARSMKEIDGFIIRNLVLLQRQHD